MSRFLQAFNRWVDITKSDTINFDGSTVALNTGGAKPCDAIYVGGAGIVVAVSQDGRTGAFTAVAGEILPIQAIRVNNTTTSATLMLALYWN